MNIASAYPSPALPAWQLTLMAIVVVGALAVWLAGVFIAARLPRYHAESADAANAIPEAHEQAGRDAERTAA
jgi:hypothetical protein